MRRLRNRCRSIGCQPPTCLTRQEYIIPITLECVDNLLLSYTLVNPTNEITNVKKSYTRDVRMQVRSISVKWNKEDIVNLLPKAILNSEP